MFAECDDYDEPEHIETLMEYIGGADNIGVAYCRNNYGTDFQYREKLFKARCNQDTLILKKEMQKHLLISCVIPNMSAALIRKKYFNHISGLSSLYRACADWNFWCRISKLCDFYYIILPLNNFRTHRTTVRNTAGIAVSMTEILMLLHNARVEIKLTALETLRFNINIGLI